MMKASSLTGFDKLLARLSADGADAGASYEALRARLVKFFEWRDCETPEELADETLDRVGRKIAAGEDLHNPAAYCVAVARLVLAEHARQRGRIVQLTEAAQLTVEPKEPDETGETDSRRFSCLENCLEKLPPEQRQLLLSYHDTDERTMIPARKRQAEQLGVSPNVLRIRVCRVKAKLEDCVRRCCAEKGV
jgi:DNA-directed RNA polymerase specialized sigma24 family protein